MPNINVTQAFLPPYEEYETYLKQIWSTAHLTNNGPLLREFEEAVKKRFGLEYFQFVTNGTLALQLAIRALDAQEGEIVTTPFSYVASTSAIMWEGATPVFVDIDPKTLCIDPDKIEQAITEKTTAILAVHVFGNICEIEKIEEIAEKHKLKVIYDGAHAFGVARHNKTVLSAGDITMCSFHATKVFHTIEGGGLIARDKHVNKKIDDMKRFGHYGDNHVTLGINAKSSEFQAAMGLLNLKYLDANIAKRKQVSELYDSLLPSSVSKPVLVRGITYNYAYYPIIFTDETTLERVVELLESNGIVPRRYFYPSLNTLNYIPERSKTSCPVSESIANRILCLPLYPELAEEDVYEISRLVTVGVR